MNDLITQILPFIGTALGGPLAGGLVSFIEGKLGVTGGTVSTIKDTLIKMVGDPAQIAKAQELEAAYKDHCMTLGYQTARDIAEFNVRAIEAVNKTMQSEAISDHWPTYTWRPFIGFSFGAYIFSFVILPLFKIAPVVLDPTLVTACGAILGISAYFRGKMQADPNVPTDNRG